MATIVVVATVAATAWSLIEEAVGVDSAFIGALCALPVVLVWCLITDARRERR